MTNKQKNYIFICFTLAATMLGCIYFLYRQKEFNAVTSFQECVNKGYYVTTTYPEECRIPGKKFININQKKQAMLFFEEEATVNDFKNKIYLIEGESTIFKNGKGDFVSSRGASSSTLQQTNTSLTVDINNDRKEDTLLLIQNISIASRDLYLTASVSLYNGFTGINGIYIDKNITNAKLTYKESKIILEYTIQNNKEKNYKYYTFENGILKEQY